MVWAGQHPWLILIGDTNRASQVLGKLLLNEPKGSPVTFDLTKTSTIPSQSENASKSNHQCGAVHQSLKSIHLKPSMFGPYSEHHKLVNPFFLFPVKGGSKLGLRGREPLKHGLGHILPAKIGYCSEINWAHHLCSRSLTAIACDR